MTNNTILTASHIRYLLALKRLDSEDGIRSIDIAKDLNLTKASVHNMMDTFLELNYITKEKRCLVYLTEYGLERATEFENHYKQLKDKLFPCNEPDRTTDNAIFAFLAELSEGSLMMLKDIR